MISDSPGVPIGLLLSGGLDSGILLGELLRRGGQVHPLYVRSGLVWEDVELAAARRYHEAMARGGRGELAQLVVLDLPLADLYEDHWSVTGREPPPADSPDEAVYMPGRSALLLIKSSLWCQLHGVDRLALGVLGSNPFADSQAEFFDAFESALNHAVGGKLRMVRPLAGLGKREVMRLGRDFPLELTFSCIAPRDGEHCGDCNKCAERKAAFRMIDREDPTRYAQATPAGKTT
jgi:7-cyano-7-deazaguanine synthase